MKPMLEVVGLKKQYDGFELRDVHFTLWENCITGFIGGNGAGKTTTIRAILGLCPKASGKIQIFGKSLEEAGKEIKNRIGVVLDEGGFYGHLTLTEMKSILAPAYTQWDEPEYRRFVERFDLNPKQKISELSKGMRMKFALVLALSHHADLLIMDEPTSGLDPLVRNELMELLLEFMKQDGKSVFFSTHITSDLDKIADMIVLIHRGRILLEEEKDALLDRHRIAKGDTQDLTPEIRRCFLWLRENGYGFTGLTKEPEAMRENMKHIVLERPTIEDIMLGYAEGGD